MPELTPGSEVPLDQITGGQPVIHTPSPEELKTTDPFGDSKTFEITKEVNEAQLQAEIEEAVGHPVQFGVHRIPGETEGILFISPGKEIDGRTVAGKIRTHKPDPYFGLTDEQRLQAEVAEKVRQGKVLSPEELTVMLQALANRR